MEKFSCGSGFLPADPSCPSHVAHMGLVRAKGPLRQPCLINLSLIRADTSPDFLTPVKDFKVRPVGVFIHYLL